MSEIEKKPVKAKKISGTVKIKKQSELQKFLSNFLADDISNIASFVKTDIVIPAIKRIISEAVNAALYSIGGGYDDRDRRSSYTSYSRKYENRDNVRRFEPRRGDAFGLDNIVLSSRADADAVLEGLEQQIDVYGVASVSDLYEELGEDCPYTGNDYGWTSMRGAKIRLVRDGYLLQLPRALPID